MLLGGIALWVAPVSAQDIVDASISFEAITISASERDSAVELELPTKTFLPEGNNIYEVPQFIAFGNSFTDVSVTISYSFRNAHPTAGRGAFIRCSVAEEPVAGSNVDFNQDGVPGAEQLRGERDFGVFRTIPRTAEPGQTISVSSATLEPVPLLLLDRGTALTFNCRLTTRVNDVPGVSIATANPIVVNQVMVPHDSIEIFFVTPAPGQTLDGGSEQDFVASIRYLLGTEDAGEIFMSLSRQDGTIVTSSERVAVENTGRARTRSSKLAVNLPFSGPLFLTGFLRGPNDEELAQSEPVRFEVALGTCSVLLSESGQKAQETSCDVDFSIRHIEVSQVVQDGNNGVPLVQDKRTMARVFVSDAALADGKSEAKSVSVRLTGKAGVAGPDLEDTPGSGFDETQTVVALRPDADLADARSRLGSSANFLLPRAWTQVNNLALTATVNLDQSDEPEIPEPELTNNSTSATFTFAERGTLDVAYIVICGGGSDCEGPDIGFVDRLSRKVLPLAEFSGMSYSPLFLPDSVLALQTELSPELAFWQFVSLIEAGDIEIFVAWLRGEELNNLQSEFLDLSFSKRVVTIDAGRSASESAMGVSLAYNIGRVFDVDAGSGCSPSSSTAGTDAIGVDPSSGPILKDLTTLSDLRANCKPPEKVWIYPGTYRSLFSQFSPASASSRVGVESSSLSIDSARQSTAQFYLVSGTVRSASGSLEPAFRLESASAAPSGSAGGTICIDVESQGARLSGTCFGRGTSSQDQPFVVRLPFDASACQGRMKNPVFAG